MLEKLTHNDFHGLVGSVFELQRSQQHDELELIEASLRGSPTSARRSFSLIFRAKRPSGNQAEYLNQGIYTLAHPEVGALELFMVPIGPDEHGMRYEVVFA